MICALKVSDHLHPIRRIWVNLVRRMENEENTDKGLCVEDYRLILEISTAFNFNVCKI